MIDFGQEPSLHKGIKRQALLATADSMIAMVPSVLPEGWSVSGAGYSPSRPQWWRIELTAPSGDVVLDQLGGTLNQRLKPHLTDLTEAEDVDLSKWGIGTWSQWHNGDRSLLAREVKGSVIIVQATDVETVTELAKSLLPADDAGAELG